MQGMGPTGHRKRHGINDIKDHVPVPGVIAGNIVVIDAITKLPIKDSGTSLASILGGLIPQGLWDASSNTPTLADGIGTLGHFYLVSVAGTQDLGSGSQTFDVNDWVLYDQLDEWKKVDQTQVASQIINDSFVFGASVKDALESLSYDSERSCGQYWASTGLGSDSAPNDGGIQRPYATGQKAIDVGLATDSVMELILDATITSQSITIPAGKKLYLFSPGALYDSSKIITVVMNDGSELWVNNVSIGIDATGVTTSCEARTENCILSSLLNPTKVNLLAFGTQLGVGVTPSVKSGLVRNLDSSWEFYDKVGIDIEGTAAKHLVSKAYVDAGAWQPNIILAGASPVDADIATYENGQKGMGIEGGAITGFADAGGGQITVTTAVAHGLSNGKVVTIISSTYNGDYVISNVGANTFEITETFAGTDTGTWTGTYYLMYNRGTLAAPKVTYVEMS